MHTEVKTASLGENNPSDGVGDLRGRVRGVPSHRQRSVTRHETLGKRTHQVTFCWEPMGQTVPVEGLVTGGTKTSRTASGRADTTARRERTKVKTENCMTELNMIVVVNVWVIVVRCEEGG